MAYLLSQIMVFLSQDFNFPFEAEDKLLSGILKKKKHAIKVIFSDESDQILNLVIPKQYDGRSNVKSG